MSEKEKKDFEKCGRVKIIFLVAKEKKTKTDISFR